MVISLKERKEAANQLRKGKKYEEAITLYNQLWNDSTDKFDGSGLLHCLRKLKRYEEAIEFAETLINKYSDFDWARNEVIWTYIEGRLSFITDKGKLQEAIYLAEKIYNLNPDTLALQKVVFTIVKLAKESNRWDIVNIWLDRINPELLADEIIQDNKTKLDWSYRALWYNNKIKCLVNNNEYEKAVELIDSILGKFPKKQEKFFLRLKALSFYRKGDLNKSEVLYSELCRQSQNDWWMLYEYALVIKEMGRKQDALQLMYKAASLSNRIDGMVGMILDIASICSELERYKEAESHYKLYVAIRKKNDWKVNKQVLGMHEELLKYIDENLSIRETLNNCRSFWTGATKEGKSKTNERTLRTTIIGNVKLGKEEVPYCFIKTENESFFCYKSELPIGATEGCQVKFDAIPSFDKKKNQESWKAKNISIYSR
ncbi:tetratricopeptide repeat protein [Brevibacillus parabrevis]|uniref:tetratricopeptide repeat protein n=1 Tax=Brevibacillus parabrevis TaxID=54914 RepID=UPI0028D5B233|nr:tetratricopeptide repeat protein [Brevibacillus parabrevis]